MAMITCPNCGEPVSDKAKKCVHCKTVLIQEEKKRCAECGAELEEGATECPNCGCPVEKISGIEENQKTISSLMKELKNPPEEYEDAYEAISELYDAYISLTNLATDPSGSLQTFSNNFNDADSETLNCYNAMKLYLDD